MLREGLAGHGSETGLLTGVSETRRGKKPQEGRQSRERPAIGRRANPLKRPQSSYSWAGTTFLGNRKKLQEEELAHTKLASLSPEPQGTKGWAGTLATSVPEVPAEARKGNGQYQGPRQEPHERHAPEG